MLKQIRQKNRYGQSVIEFMVLIVLILGAFLVFQKYIVRSFAGRWKGVGDSLGSGHIYDAQRTLECAYDPKHTFEWYNLVCYEDNCIEDCLTVAYDAAACKLCIEVCTPGPGDVPNCYD